MMSPNDSELIVKAQQGDDSAFEMLIEKYDRHVLSLAFSYTRNSDDTKDIYQETFIRAYKSIRGFQFRSEFSTWLYRIAVNVCLTYRKHKVREADVFSSRFGNEEEMKLRDETKDPSPDNSAEGDYMRKEIAMHIESALDRLSPMQRLVFTMKHYEGYRLREIAKMINCTEGTVKKHLFNAVKRLQVQLKGVLD